MRWIAVLVLGAVMLTAALARADDTFPNVQYVSGKAGFADKVKGTLTLTATELRFTDKDGKPVFTIPLGEVKAVTNSVEQNPGSTGAKLMLGVFASKKEEFLYVNTETETAAEALVFKCKGKTSPAMVAKISFATKKLNTPAESGTEQKASASGGSTAPAASTTPETQSQSAAADSLNVK
jgi:hypothetical protein